MASKAPDPVGAQVQAHEAAPIASGRRRSGWFEKVAPSAGAGAAVQVPIQCVVSLFAAGLLAFLVDDELVSPDDACRSTGPPSSGRAREVEELVVNRRRGWLPGLDSNQRHPD